MENPVVITITPDEIGYQYKTTFWQDFSIADKFGPGAVRDTFNRAFEEWKTNHIYLTDLVIVLNHKLWQWHEKNKVMATLYNELWSKAAEYAETHLKGEELSYYYQETD